MLQRYTNIPFHIIKRIYIFRKKKEKENRPPDLYTGYDSRTNNIKPTPKKIK